MRAMHSATRSGAGSDGALLVQRCACGKSASGMCEECQAKEPLGLQPKLIVGPADDPFEREADRAAEAVVAARTPVLTAGPVVHVARRAASTGGGGSAPRSVARAVEGPGEPLPQSARSYFEPRFGHDFGKVRVHRDARATASARDIAARAYTVGHHVVFGNGSYAPGSRAGRTLIAHELAHVIQQTGTVQRHALSPPLSGRPDTEKEGAEEEELQLSTPAKQDEESYGGVSLVQRAPLDEAFPDDPWPEKTEAAMIRAEMEAAQECLKNTSPDPVECDPNRDLAWTDFAGTPDMASPYNAIAPSHLQKRAANTALLKCLPQTAAAQAANPSGVQAVFDGDKAWGKPMATDPTNAAVNGCAAIVDQCQGAFAKPIPGWAIKVDPDKKCPAQVAPRGDRATSRDECETIVGKDCRDWAVAESNRLLKHEQGHFDITCALARKANATITKTTDVDKLVAAAEAVKKKQQKLYDAETRHGCDAGKQASWETAIAAGLPDVDLKVKP